MRTLWTTALAVLLAPALLTASSGRPSDPEPGARPATGLPWHESLDEALAASERSGRPVLIDLYAEWCGLCHKLDREVFASEAFHRYAADRFVFLRVDIDDGGEGSLLGDRFTSTVPTVVLVDHRLALIGIVRGYLPPGPFVGRLEIALQKHQEVLATYRRLMQQDDPDELLPFAEALMGRGDGARAATIYQRLIDRGYEPPGGEVRLRFRLAEALRLGRDLAAAEEQVRLLRSYRSASENEALSEGLALLEIAIARDRSDCAGATDAVEAFLDRHPNSRRTGEALATLRRIETDPRASCQ